jgi:AraC-like DNA-binding protein
MEEERECKTITDKIIGYAIGCDLITLGRLTVDSLAGHFLVEKGYMSEKFKKDIEISLEEYLISLKIYRAALILGKSSKERDQVPIRQIAYILGFHDLSIFTRRFWDHIGTTPEKFRTLTDWSE